MTKVQQTANRNQKPAHRLVALLVKLAIGYAFASLAINSGSLWQYAIAILAGIGTVVDLVKLIGIVKRKYHG